MLIPLDPSLDNVKEEKLFAVECVEGNLSRSEEITSEVRRLVLTCRSMEAQLQQSIPKKTHQEVVAKMQAAIDGSNAELERTKAELQKTFRLEEEMKSLSEQISAQSSAIMSQWQSNEAKRIHELEEKMSAMVDKTEYSALQNKYEELKASTVSKEDYIVLQNQFSKYVPRESLEQMQKSFAETTVPREQLLATEAKMRELETTITNCIPRSEHEELVTEITSIIGEASRILSSLEPQQTERAPSTDIVDVAPPEPLRTTS